MPGQENTLISLSSMAVGQKGLVVAFSFATESGEQVQEMGLGPGDQLEMVRRPPSGDAIEIKIRGYFISLGKQEADRIMVRILS